MKSIYLPILAVVTDITVSSGIFDKTICWLIVTGKLNKFFFPMCIYNIKKIHPQCNFCLREKRMSSIKQPIQCSFL